MTPLDLPGGAQAEIERLQRELDAARQSIEAQARWLSHVSHELRTPMNAVLGLTGLLLETEGDLKGAVRELRTYAKLIDVVPVHVQEKIRSLEAAIQKR